MQRTPSTTIRDFFQTLEEFTTLLEAATKELQRPGRQTAPRDLTFTAGLEYAIERYGAGAIITGRDIQRLREIINPPEVKRIHIPPPEDSRR